MKRAHYIWIGFLVTLAVASATSGADSWRVTAVDSPASAASMTPHLASSGDGLYASWLERVADGHALLVARWDGTRFGEARTVYASDQLFANWADFPSVLPLGNDRLAAHWLEKAADGAYEYDVWISRSADDGITWSTPERPHRDGTLSEHGFVSMVPQGDSSFAAVWLDGREFRKGASDNEMTLQFTTFGEDGFEREVLLDRRVCECCQTGMAQTEDGLFVAYRDRSGSEIRDISYVRHVDGAWTEPRAVNDDGWELSGCPVNGPQVAADGNRLAVAWFTAADATPRVQVVFSEDNGASFGPPVRVDDGNPVGRVDIEWAGADVVVSWVERLEGRDGDVRLKTVTPSGSVEPAVVVAKTGSGRASGFPRIAQHDGDVFISWTESYERNGPSQVRIAALVRDVALDVTLVDEPAKNFAAVGIDGYDYTLDALSGRVVLLNFWGIWCTKCRDEIPQLIELDKERRDDGLVILGADYGDNPADLPAFVSEFGMTYPVLFDDGLADDYEVLIYPTSVVIDRSGRIRYRVEGYTEASFETLSRVVDRLLDES